MFYYIQHSVQIKSQKREAGKGSKNKEVIETQRGTEKEREGGRERDVSGLCGGPSWWQSASDFHSLLRWMRSQPDQEQTAAFLLLMLSLVFWGKGHYSKQCLFLVTIMYAHLISVSAWPPRIA